MPGRAAVGPRSGGGRPLENTRLGPVEAAFEPTPAEIAENAKGGENPDRWPVVTYSPVVSRPVSDRSALILDRFESVAGSQTEMPTAASAS